MKQLQIYIIYLHRPYNFVSIRILHPPDNFYPLAIYEDALRQAADQQPLGF